MGLMWMQIPFLLLPRLFPLSRYCSTHVKVILFPTLLSFCP